jgi:hypothetical protein
MSVRDTVNEWFRQRLATGALGRDTEAYNQVVAALPELIEQLEPGADPAPVATADTPADTGTEKPSVKGQKPAAADPSTPGAPGGDTPTSA